MRDFNALIVSYAFPPVGGAGVQRSAKLVKYLHEFGISPSVLTVSNPSVPLHDDTLLNDIPAGTRIVRAATLEPGYAAKKASWENVASVDTSWVRWARKSAIGAARQLLIPDPQVLWLPSASLALGKELRTRCVDCVLITAPPFPSSFLHRLFALSHGIRR